MTEGYEVLGAREGELWSASEERLLRELWQENWREWQYRRAQIAAARLGRPWKGVHRKARRMGLCMKSEAPARG